MDFTQHPSITWVSRIYSPISLNVCAYLNCHSLYLDWSKGDKLLASASADCTCLVRFAFWILLVLNVIFFFKNNNFLSYVNLPI